MIGFRFPDPRSWTLAPESTGGAFDPTAEVVSIARHRADDRSRCISLAEPLPPTDCASVGPSIWSPDFRCGYL